MKAFQQFAYSMQAAIKAVQLYSAAHPRAVEATQALQTAVTHQLAETDRFRVASSRSRLLFNGVPVELTPQVIALRKQMEERRVAGVLIERGVQPDELQSLVALLAMKPQEIEGAGGATDILAARGAVHVRTLQVRYEEMLDDEEIVQAGTARQPVDEAPSLSTEELVIRALQAILSESGKGGDDTSVLAAFGGSHGTSHAMPGGAPDGGAQMRRSIADQLSGLQKRIEGGSGAATAIGEFLASAPVRQRVALVAALEHLPAGPVREAIASHAARTVADAAAEHHAERGSLEGVHESIIALLRFVPKRDEAVKLLHRKLIDAGVGASELNDLIEKISWEHLTLDQRAARVLSHPPGVLVTSAARIATLIRQLIQGGRFQDAARIADHAAKGISAEDSLTRRKACEVLSAVTRDRNDVAVPPEVEAVAERALLTHFLRETDPVVQPVVTAAVSDLIGHWMIAGEPERAYRALGRLDSAVGVISASLHWKGQALSALLDSLLLPERTAVFVERLYGDDLETVAAQYFPLLTFLRERAAVPLIDALATDEDRSHRARLVRAIIAIGKPALAPVVVALDSPTWYIVRNAATLLGDLNAHDHVDDLGRALRHEHAKVRKAAARALGQLGTVAAEKLLRETMIDVSEESKADIQSALSAIAARRK